MHTVEHIYRRWFEESRAQGLPRRAAEHHQLLMHLKIIIVFFLKLVI